MSALWTSQDAAAATGGRLEGQDWMASGLSIDSRTLQVGDLFVALDAARDGHDFAADAFERGAAGALVAKRPAGLPPDAPLLIVKDTLAALRALAVAGRERSTARRIGVTGSVGKTTVKTLLKAGLSALGPTHAAAKSFNNHWGVPLTLASLPPDAAFGVFEMGMNAPGEIADLTALVRPEVAVVTAIAPAHLERLGSLEAIARAKAEIFEGLAGAGVAVIPAACEHGDVLRAAAERAGARILTFGEEAQADVRLLSAAPKGDGQQVRILISNTEQSFYLALPGRHNALNACAALAVVHGVGGDVAAAAAGLVHVAGEAGRGAIERMGVDGGAITLIDDSYNANPASMRAGLALLAATDPGPGGRRVAVLGDMLELGPDGPRLHADLAADAAAAADVVHAAGPLSAALFASLPEAKRGRHAGDAEALGPHLAADLRAGDVVFIKGSRGAAMERAVEALRAHARAAEKDPV